MAKQYKKSDESFGQSKLLQDSYASIIYKEQMDKVASANTTSKMKSTVFINSKQDKRDQLENINKLNEAADERALEMLDNEEDIELLSDDENDPELAIIKAKRMMEIKMQYEKAQDKKGKGMGEYLEVTQDEFLKQVTKSKYTVCSFYHDDFERCKIVDKHMAHLARHHDDTKFIKINVAKSPFFVDKLAIKTLPCVIIFLDGKAIDRIVGFDDFGGDDFSTVQFHARLWATGVIDDDKGIYYKPKAGPTKTLLDLY